MHKILPFILLPLGLTFTLIIAGVVFRRRLFCFIGLAILLFSTMPVTSDLVMRSVEGWKTRLPVKTMPEADAIVVLSSSRTLAPGNPPVSEWDDPDRFFGGIELFKAGKAPLIIFTGGWVPWRPDMEPEGLVLIRNASASGIPEDCLITTGKVSNTAEEAEAVLEILRTRSGDKSQPRILLVTSAYHMRRSVMLFGRAGFDVNPFPVDFQVSAGERLSVFDFIPTGSSLRQTEIALREVYGYLFYLIKK
ncbi:MAG: YdcF family protein [Bacteroidales bacterium]|nr:YdcF family protein [Bacteroidales bacterium]